MLMMCTNCGDSAYDVLRICHMIRVVLCPKCSNDLDEKLETLPEIKELRVLMVTDRFYREQAIAGQPVDFLSLTELEANQEDLNLRLRSIIKDLLK